MSDIVKRKIPLEISIVSIVLILWGVSAFYGLVQLRAGGAGNPLTGQPLTSFATLEVLVSATILFFPPLALLGTVSPFAIRLKAAALDQVGRTSGNLFAVSTVASVAAAIATGFFLIPNEIRRI